MKYVAYTRVSTKRQGESKLGLEAQEGLILHYFPEVDKWFRDVKSGKNITDRAELIKAIEYCKKENATLVIAKVDRLSRNVEDGLWVLKELNGRLRFCDIPGDTDKFSLTLFLAFAEREREIIRVRIKQALDAKKARGEEWNKGSRISQSMIREAARVRSEKAANDDSNVRAYAYADSLRQSGMTYSEIARELNENRYKSPKGSRWHSGSVYRLIK